jgi:hypothetical protein
LLTILRRQTYRLSPNKTKKPHHHGEQESSKALLNPQLIAHCLATMWRGMMSGMVYPSHGGTRGWDPHMPYMPTPQGSYHQVSLEGGRGNSRFEQRRDPVGYISAEKALLMKEKSRSRAKICMQNLRVRRAAISAQKLNEFTEATPLRLLARPNENKIGINTRDYGAHELALNFPYEDMDANGKVDGESIGGFTLGLTYDTDHHSVSHPGRTLCKTSEQFKDWLMAARDTLKACWFFPSGLHQFADTLHLNCIRGAQTKWHTDAFYGATDNYVLIHDHGPVVPANEDDNHPVVGGEDEGYLLVDTFPLFRCSVVKYCHDSKRIHPVPSQLVTSDRGGIVVG